MKILRTEFSTSTCKTMDEQLAINLMFAIKEPDTVIAWEHRGIEVASFCLLCNDDFIRFSVSKANISIRKEAVSIMRKLLGEIRRTFIKESCVDPGVYIHYYEWNSSDYKKIKEMLS